MTDTTPAADLSHLSREFTDGDITVDVLIYKIEGNDGWTLEVALDDETSVTWTELFPTDEEAWEDFTRAIEEVGLRRLVDGDDSEEVTIH
jgi:hypothetical protein